MNTSVLQRRSWPAFAALCALILLLAVGGDSVRALLRYDRAGLAAGQWWRLLTAHFVHLGFEHALLNLTGLGLLWALFAPEYRARQWLLIVACAMAAIDAGLWFLASTVDWYVGSSGVLHGVLAAGIVAWLRARRLEGGLLALALGCKLAWERFQGPLPLTAGGEVITQAHLYGVVGGLTAALALASIVPGLRRIRL